MEKKVDIIFPPQWIPTHLYLAGGLLHSCLNQEGNAGRFFDLNLAFYKQVIGVELVALLKNEFFVLEKLKHNMFLIDEKLKAYSNKDFEIRFFDLKSKYKAYRARELFAAIEAQENYFMRFYKEYFRRIDFEGVEVIGISIISYSQLIPALTLCRYFKKKLPSLKIIVGGNMISRMVLALSHQEKFWELVDAVAVCDGEPVMSGLSFYLNQEKAIRWGGIPNIIFLENNEVKRGKNVSFNLMNYLSPDYSEFKLEEYFLPIPVISLEMSRGCYWGKCAFCETTGEVFKKRAVRDVVNEVEAIHRLYGLEYFSFSDLALPPASMFEFAELILKKKLKVFWKGLIRPERFFLSKDLKILKESGLIMLQIGIESFSQRILDLMKKGTEVDVIKSVIKKFSNSGVWIHGYFLIGFPGEALTETKETFQFIRDYGDMLPSFSISPFNLLKDSEVFNNPFNYGINIKETKDDDMRTSYFKHSGCKNILESPEVETWVNELIHEHPYDYDKWGELDINFLFLYIAKMGFDFFKKESN